MKKTYIAPATMVVKVEQCLLQASLPKDSQSTISSNDRVLSRQGGSSWDDEDEY